MSLKEIHPDLLVNVILPFLPARFLLDYQLAPIWFKILPINYHSTLIQFSHNYLFSKRYEKNKCNLLDIMMKIIDCHTQELQYGSISSFVPQDFLYFVDRVQDEQDENFECIRKEISFREMQFVFEFVSRYNFTYLGLHFNILMNKCREPVEFSWVYAVDEYYQTNHSLMLRRFWNVSEPSTYIYTTLESMNGCKRIRGQFYFKNGRYCCELYNGLFQDIKKFGTVDNVRWQFDVSFIEQKPISAEYFLQRYYLPALDTKISFSTVRDITPGYQFYTESMRVYSKFNVSIIPSQNKFEVRAQLNLPTQSLILLVGLWMLLLYFNIIWPFSNYFVFQSNLESPYYWKAILYIISDIFTVVYPAIYPLRSMVIYYLGFWIIHHVSIVETYLYCYLFSNLFYYAKTFYSLLRYKTYYSAPIPWKIKKK